MSDQPQNGSQDPNAPEERKEPAAPQTPPPGDGGDRPFYLRPPFIAGAVIAIVAVVAIAFLAGPSGKEGPEQQAKAEAPANDLAEATGWQLGRPGDIVMGSPDAPVKLVEYASLTCGHCAAFKLAVFPDIKKKYIDTGLVQYTLREFPTPPVALSVRGFMLARCTGEDRYYQALEALFRTQPLWVKPNPQEARDNLAKISRQFGLNEAEFQACIEDEQELKRINEVVQAGSELYDINSTPSFVINGEKAEIRGATFDALDSAIQANLPEGTEVPDYTPTGYNRTESGEPEADDDAAEEGEGSDASDEGASEEGDSDEGTADEGAADEGAADEGTSDEGDADEGAADVGTSDEGDTEEGTADEGTPDEGTSEDGATEDGASDEETSDEDTGEEGASEDSGDNGEEGAPETEE